LCHTTVAHCVTTMGVVWTCHCVRLYNDTVTDAAQSHSHTMMGFSVSVTICVYTVITGTYRHTVMYV